MNTDRRQSMDQMMMYSCCCRCFMRRNTAYLCARFNI